MLRYRSVLLILSLAACLSACNQQPPAAAEVVKATKVAETTEATEATEAATAPAPADAGSPPAAVVEGVHDKEGNLIPLVAFDIETLPLSNAALGALPFFGLPHGYEPFNTPHLRDWARFPVRIGAGLHWVGGRTWSGRIDVDSSSGKSFSLLELQRNLENLITAAGGGKVFEGPLLRDAYYGPELEEEIGGGFIEAVNLSHAVVQVYVVRQAQRNIWVQLAFEENSNDTRLVVIEEIPFQPTAHWGSEFPYLSMPAGYNDRDQPVRRDFDRFPFWTGAQFEQVEGRTWQANFGKSEASYSMDEVRRNLDAMVASVNGTLVFAGRLSKAQDDAVPDAVKSAYHTGAGYGWNEDELRVYRADLANGHQVWVHARMSYGTASWVVAEREGFQQTAALLPAAELKQQLDRAGKVALQVNFATDKTEILADSQPQIEQVVRLLQNDPALQLDVNGHTDNSGDPAHNQTLSEGRAAAVVAALSQAGIASDRLRAAGFGDRQPVADNSSEDGKAKNRRVELVKR